MEDKNKILERFKIHAPVLDEIIEDIAQYTLGGKYTLHTTMGKIIFEVNGLNIRSKDEISI